MNFGLICKTLFLTLLLCGQVLAQSQTSTTKLPSFGFQKWFKHVDTELWYTHDFVSNTGGEKSGPRNIGALDLYASSDFSKFSRLNGEVMVHYIHLNSNDTRGAVGDTQLTSNIEMPSQVDRIGDLWYQHSWDERAKLLVGIHDISTEFYLTESSLNFLNSSFGTGAELTYAGENGPSLYPMTTLGTRLQLQFTDNSSLSIGMYDSDPGGEEAYRKMGSGIGGAEGYFQISEFTHQFDNQKIGLGFWNHSKKQATIDDPNETDLLYGAYTTIEKEVRKNIWGFARFGWSNPKVNSVSSNMATGAVIRGLLQKKKNQDEAGVGLSQAYITEEENSEIAYELYYQFKAMKELTLKPDIQYVSNPSGSTEIKDAWVMGLRTIVEL